MAFAGPRRHSSGKKGAWACLMRARAIGWLSFRAKMADAQGRPGGRFHPLVTEQALPETRPPLLKRTRQGLNPQLFFVEQGFIGHFHFLVHGH